MALEISSRLVLETKDYLRNSKSASKATDQFKDSIEDVNDSSKTYKKRTDEAADSTDRLGEKSSKTAAQMGKTAAKFAAAGTAIAAATTYVFIDAAREAENYQLRLNRLLGSTEEGNRLFKDMAEYAGRVPFAYQEIMSSATQLAGVMSGGVDEINEWMPLIGDLAAVSGLSIEQTTEQVVRMYSAGAGAADLFRERGITSMLGFQAGVSYSAEETREKLIEAFEDPLSKFRGASGDLAQSWDGILSMMSDKWFTFRTQIMDEGLFEYFKELAIIINEKLGEQLDESQNKARDWSNATIKGISSIIRGSGDLLDIMDLLLVGLNQLHNSGLTIANIGTNLSSLSAYYGKLSSAMAFQGEEAQRYYDRILLENQAKLDGRTAQIAQNNIDILKLVDRDWTEIADRIASRAEDAAAGVQAANDTQYASHVDLYNRKKALDEKQQAEQAAIRKEELKAAQELYKKQVKSAQSKLDAVIRATDTERDSIEKWYKDSVGALIEAERLKLDAVEDYGDLRLKLDEEYQERLKALEDKKVDDNQDSLDKRFDSLGQYGDDVADLYDVFAGDWEDLTAEQILSAADSFDTILDNWEDLLKQMLIQWGLSELADVFNFDLSGLGIGGLGGTTGINPIESIVQQGGKQLFSSLFGGSSVAPVVGSGVAEVSALAGATGGAPAAVLGTGAAGQVVIVGSGSAGAGAVAIGGSASGTAALAGATGGAPAAVLGSGATGQAAVVGAQAAPLGTTAGAAQSGGFTLAGVDPVTLAIFAGIGLLSQSGGRSALEIANGELSALSTGERGVYNPSTVTGNTDRLGILNEDITFFRDPDSNLERAAEILQGEMGYDRSFSFGDGFLKVESERLDAFEQADIILQQTADSIIRADAEWEHFREALEDGSLSSATTVADAFAVGFGRTGESAKIAFKKIKDIVVEWEEHGGMNADQFAKSVADAFNIGVDEAKRFLDQTGLVQEDFRRGFDASITDVSRTIVNEFQSSIGAVEQEFVELGDTVKAQASGIESDFGVAAQAIESTWNSMRLKQLNGTINVNQTGSSVQPNGAPIRSFDVGSPRVMGNQLAQIHDNEIIVDSNTADSFRKGMRRYFGVNMQNTPTNNTEMKTLLSEVKNLVRALNKNTQMSALSWAESSLSKVAA